MDLTTTYLGFTLPHPFMPGASPLVDDLDTVRRLEDAGAAAIVMHSLFEEQLVGEQLALRRIRRRARRTPPPRRCSYLPRPRGLRARPGRVPGAGAPHQGGGRGAGHRLAQRPHRGRLAALRPPPRAGGRGRARAQHLRARHRPANESAAAIEDASADHGADGARRPVGRRWRSSCRPSTRSLAQPGAPPGRGGRRRPGAVQPLLPARHRHRGARGGERTLQLSSSAELLLRLSWLAILSATHRPVAGRQRRRAHRHRRRQGGHGRRARGADWSRPCCATASSTCGRCAEAAARWLEEHEYDSLRQMQGSMNLAALPRPERLRARQLRPRPAELALGGGAGGARGPA